MRFTQQAISESLENRRLLAASFATLGRTGTLAIVGDEDNNRIVISSDGTTVTVTFDGRAAQFARNQVKRVDVDARGGNDRVSHSVRVPATLVGGSGDDRLYNNTSAPSQLDGSTGSNRLVGGSGADYLYGSNDIGPTYLVGGLGNDTILASGLKDIVDYRDHPGSIQYLDVRGTDEDGDEINDEVRSDFGNDLIPGGSEHVIYGTGFSDSFAPGRYSRNYREFYGFEGNDIFGSGRSSALVDGGEGDDTFSPSDADFYTEEEGIGVQEIIGGPGNDLIRPGVVLPFNLIDLGPGDDTIDMIDSQTDSIDFAEGRSAENIINIGSLIPQSIAGTSVAERLIAAGDNPVTINGDGGNDQIEGGHKNDSLIGGHGDDTLRGGDGNDTLSGGGGRDRLFGDGGDDLLLARGGSKDRLDGGSGFDTATADTLGSVIDLVIDVEAVS